jgi:hypothetical protein
VPARVAVGERAREALEVERVGGRAVRLLSAVRPLGRAPDRDEELHPALLRAAREVIDVLEPVHGVERVDRAAGPLGRGGVPGHGRADHGGVRVARAVERGRAVGRPAERGVVLEAYEEAPGHRRLGKHGRRRFAVVAREEEDCCRCGSTGRCENDERGDDPPHLEDVPEKPLHKAE